MKKDVIRRILQILSYIIAAILGGGVATAI